MDDQTARQLVELNRVFYEQFGAEFADSRRLPQPGWTRLVSLISGRERVSVLDVGCGDGRFGRFLVEQIQTSIDYLGVDFATSLLGLAAANQRFTFISRDLSVPGCLASLGSHDLIVCLSTLQHLPGRENRVRLMGDMADCLAADGTLVLANWQFVDSPRQRRKIRPWSEAGLRPEMVEAGDYLLTWERGGSGLRYVAMIDEPATAELAAAAGLRVVEQFRSDGREGDLNLYSVLRR